MKTASIKQNSIRLSLIRLIESGVAGPPNKVFTKIFCRRTEKAFTTFIYSMQNAQKIHRSRKKIARMSRGGVVREITLGLRTVSSRNLKKVHYIFPSTNYFCIYGRKSFLSLPGRLTALSSDCLKLGHLQDFFHFSFLLTE